MASEALDILIGGEAGQGLVTIGQVLAKALVKAGYHILVTQDYLSRVRGGHNTFRIRTGPNLLVAPREGVDLLVALDQESLDLHAGALRPGAQVIADIGLTCGLAPCLNLPYADLAPARYQNTVALGAAASLLGLEMDLIARELAAFLGKKMTPEVTEKNRAALKAAYDFTATRRTGFKPLPPPVPAGPRLMINGNEALALGALAAGLKFLAFYPMTPATAIALTAIAHAKALGVVCEQAEDEIAAINMALGAAYAGAPAMVCTSGGGFALMCEGVSLAGMSENPLLIALAMRPGPATGLPTRTEQGDLELALFAGHGEFPRAIYAPGTVEDCFSLAALALAQAEKHQGPIFILTDQFLADSYRAVEPFDLGAVQPVRPGLATVADEQGYRRYALTDSGISPRALPGLSRALVVSDSDEHTEDGHLTEDLAVRVAMQDKRLRKLAGLLADRLLPSFQGPEDAELLLVGWGSTLGSLEGAAAQLSAQGRRVGVCHFSQVWPLAGEDFLERFARAGQVVMVEGNATGQLAALIRRETGYAVGRLVLRYDGLPITPEYILRQLAD
ncbi:MAG: 2-oxoacid:acceptor oxidoreductase subunit alpha [Desulfarculus sp.]|nr:2-oxoacid:acceptor oxidoreductase subunit alpha [Desulfarculus sp.]